MQENFISYLQETQSFPKNFTVRFWKKVVKTSDCWNWIGSKNGEGYGHIGLRHPTILKAHRASWMIHYGPIPEQICVLHKCDNPSCVRPDHLFLGTRLDNIRDMDKKQRRGTMLGKRFFVGERHRSAKLTRELANKIRNIPKEISSRKVAGMFGVSHRTIQDVRKFVTWKFV